MDTIKTESDFERLKRLNGERTQGKWHVGTNGRLNIQYFDYDDGFVFHSKDEDFITLSANLMTRLLAVCDASDNITNLYYELKEMDIKHISPNAFWSLMQKYCNEYGGLKLALEALKGEI